MSEAGAWVFCLSEETATSRFEQGVVACQVAVESVHATLEGAQQAHPAATWDERGDGCWYGTLVEQKFSGPVIRHYWIERFQVRP